MLVDLYGEKSHARINVVSFEILASPQKACSHNSVGSFYVFVLLDRIVYLDNLKSRLACQVSPESASDWNEWRTSKIPKNRTVKPINITAYSKRLVCAFHYSIFHLPRVSTSAIGLACHTKVRGNSSGAGSVYASATAIDDYRETQNRRKNWTACEDHWSGSRWVFVKPGSKMSSGRRGFREPDQVSDVCCGARLFEADWSPWQICYPCRKSSGRREVLPWNIPSHHRRPVLANQRHSCHEIA